MKITYEFVWSRVGFNPSIIFVWLWRRLGDIDSVIRRCVVVVVVGWQWSSRDESIDVVWDVNSGYWFKDDPLRGDNSSWPFWQVIKAVEEEGENEEIGDDKGTVLDEEIL
jgi:hypothetical protein